MRICKNEITDDLRRLFGANPLKIPDETYQPLLMIEIVNNRPKILGQFQELIKGNFDLNLKIETRDLAEISGRKTRKVQFDFGFELLGNFFKGFGMSAIGIESSLKNTKNFTFSFSNVQRKYFSPLALGKVLSENEIYADPNNFIIEKIIKDKKLKLGLVTDVIISNSFSMNTFDASDNQAKIDIPTIQGYVDNIKAGTKIEKISESEIKFENEKSLTFAFSCIEIQIDPETGKFSRGDWLNDIKAKGITTNVETLSEEELNLQSKFLFDDNEFNPLLIE